MTFIEKPNLPTSKVTVVAMSTDEPELKKALNKLSISTIEIEKNINLAEPVARHTDMILNHLGNNKILIDRYSENINNVLESMGFRLTFAKKCLTAKFPNDVALNSAIIGNICITRQSSTDDLIIDHCKQNKIKILDVKQGYSKCSICIVNTNSIITDDKCIDAIAKKNDIDSLLINKGSIKLNGYNYGFIGGCCGLIDNNLLAITGDISQHSDYKLINNFLNSKNVNYICLTPKPLFDIGGIMPLMQL